MTREELESELAKYVPYIDPSDLDDDQLRKVVEDMRRRRLRGAGRRDEA